jgi:hypothetical protein
MIWTNLYAYVYQLVSCSTRWTYLHRSAEAYLKSFGNCILSIQNEICLLSLFCLIVNKIRYRTCLLSPIPTEMSPKFANPSQTFGTDLPADDRFSGKNITERSSRCNSLPIINPNRIYVRLVPAPPNGMTWRLRSRLIFWGYSVQISTGTPAILIEGFPDFPQPLRENSVTVPRLGHDRFIPNPSQFVSHPIIRRYEILTASVIPPPILSSDGVIHRLKIALNNSVTF